MESSGASKRTADSELTGDTYAVCTNCTRLSSDLKICDKCGSALSAENSEGCYSSEPKRARTEIQSPNTNSNLVNGNHPPSNSSSPDNTAAPVPVPQALYKNKNLTDEVSLRPQALFSSSTPNLGGINPSLPSVVGGSSTVVGNAANTNQMQSLNSMLPSNRSVISNVPGMDSPSLSLMSAASGSASSLAAPQQQQQRLPGPAQTIQVPSRVSSYNLQPPAPPQYPLSNVQRPAQDSNHTTNNAAAVSNNIGGGNPHKLNIESNCVNIPALEIRIGSQKFKPITAVSFKDDGILFTLKDYTYAPVLLNARAILRCKANLNLLNYPVFLLYLEASCMKQIRNIFGLKDEDFGENNACELKRCISIFPSIVNESAQDVIRLNVVGELKHMFSLMEKRYMRYNKILEEMTPEEALDLMLSLLNSNNLDNRSNGTGPVATTALATSQQRNDRTRLATGLSAPAQRPQTIPRPAPPQLHNNMVPHRPINNFPQAMQNTYHRPGNMNLNAVVPRTIPPISTATTGQQPVFRATNPAGPRGAPVVQIPTDNARWQELQKSLVVGGVYHVQQPGPGKKTMYCLWNGTQLVPCLVQNTEVQLECEQVWIGSLRAKAMSHVRVKADQTQGLYVTIDKDNRDSGSRKEIDIRLSEIVTCHVCIDQRMACMFVDLTDGGAERIRKSLGIHVNVDPAFNPRSSEEKKKRFILFLKNVNQDQWDALTSMKFNGRRTSVFVKIEVLPTLKILADIKSNSRVQSKITDWINKKSLPSNLIAVENIAKELSNPDDNSPANADDDDDDDVIMTQEEVGVKCPYTQQIMKDPIKNKICGHNYEKSAIIEFMSRKKGNAKCPYAGCGNAVPLKMSDLEDNFQLKEYIRKNTK